MNTRSLLLALLSALSVSSPAAVAEIRYRAQLDFRGHLVEQLAIDSNGSVLVSTDTGIVRWTGTRLEPIFQGKTGGFLHRDRKGNLWTELDYGGPDWNRLVRIDPSGQAIPLTVTTWVMDIAEDDTGVVWVATDEGLYAFKDTTRVYHPSFKSDSLDSYLNSLAFDDAGNLWVAGCRGIARISPDRKISYVKADGWVKSIRKAPDGAMWASTSEGLLRWDGTAWVQKAPGLSAQIAFGSDGKLYYRADSSILVWNGSALDTFSKSPHRVSGRMPPLVADKEGRLWTASGSDSLLELDLATGRATHHPLFEDGYPGRGSKVHQDSLGRLWVATNAGLTLYDSRGGKRTFPVNTIQVIEPRAGEIWGVDSRVGRDLFRFKDDSISHLSHSTNLNQVVTSTSGEVVARESSRIFRYAGSDQPIVESADSITLLDGMTFCPDGRLVLGGHYSENLQSWYGLWKPAEGKWVRDVTTHGSPTSLLCDARGDLWFTASNSLFRRRGSTTRQVVLPNHESVVSFLSSPQRRMFVMGRSGLFLFDALDSLVPVPGWDSASLAARGMTLSDLSFIAPAGPDALWFSRVGQILFLDDAPWIGEVGVKPRTTSARTNHLATTRRSSGWTLSWSGSQDASLVATDLAGRTLWSGKVGPGGSVSLDRPERFLVVRAVSAGSPAEVRKLAAP